jgi:nitrate reductase gamma subunit
MHATYSIIAGPLLWAAMILFLGGLVFRVIRLLAQINKTEKFIYTYMSWKYSWRSIGHWLTPFGTTSWRLHPVMTIVTFLFHICLFIAPLFLLGHGVMVTDAWGVQGIALPDGLADAMTLIVVAGCIFFFVRRKVRPEVRFVTDASDYVLLLLVAAPFVTGFLAYHQVASTGWMTIAHMLTGEILLAAIPFARLRHMILSVFTRAYMGSEFGKVRHAKDW